MPKKIVITKKMIDEIVFQMVREEGIEVLTARNIAKKLNCSTQPIYKTYKNLEELKKETLNRLAEFMLKSIVQYKRTNSPFLDSGLGYINFAKKEKTIFKIFSLETKDHNLLEKDSGNEVIRQLMEKDLEGVLLSKESKDSIFLQTMIFTYGLAVSVFLGNYELDEEKIAYLLVNAFEGYVNLELGGNNNEYSCPWRKS